MTEQDGPQDRQDRQESAWERRRRLAKVFGDTEPSTTQDERDDEPRRGTEDPTEAWLRSQVPPHHGS